MSSKKSRPPKNEPRLRPLPVLLAVLLLAGNAFLAHNLFVSESGLPGFLRIQGEQQRLQRNLNRLVGERAKLSRNIQLLENDDVFAERIIREKSRFVRPGEVVYFIVDSTKGASTGLNTPRAPSMAGPESTP